MKYLPLLGSLNSVVVAPFARDPVYGRVENFLEKQLEPVRFVVEKTHPPGGKKRSGPWEGFKRIDVISLFFLLHCALAFLVPYDRFLQWANCVY